MGFRFRKTVKIAPGVKLNVGKKSASVRFGGKGAGVTLNSKGKVTGSVGIPGTGLYYTESTQSSSAKNKNSLSCFKIALLVIFYPIGIGYLIYKLVKKLNNNKADNIQKENKRIMNNHSDFNKTDFELPQPPMQNEDINKRKKSKKKYIPIIIIVVIALTIIGFVQESFSKDDTVTEPATTPTVEKNTVFHSYTDEKELEGTELTSEIVTESNTENTTKNSTNNTTEKLTEKVTEKFTQKPTEKQIEKPTQKPSSNSGYVVNVNTKKIHRSNCQHVNSNCVSVSADEIRNYEACKTCNPY